MTVVMWGGLCEKELCNKENVGIRVREGPHSGSGGKLTWHYSHARGSRIQKRAEVRAREGGDRRRGVLSRRKVWGGRSPGLRRLGPKAERRGAAEEEERPGRIRRSGKMSKKDRKHQEVWKERLRQRSKRMENNRIQSKTTRQHPLRGMPQVQWRKEKEDEGNKGVR